MKIPPPSSGDFPELPEMEPIKVQITEISDAFPSTYEGKTKEQIKITLTPLDPDLEAAHVFAFVTLSWHEKAGHGVTGLRNIVNAVHAADLSEEDLYAFDTDDLIDKTLIVVGKYKDPKQRSYLTPVGYKRVAGKKAAPKVAEPEPEAAGLEV